MSRDATGKLPYAFARAQGVLCAEVADGVARLLVREDADLLAIAEARRGLGLPVRVQALSRTAFERELAERYSAGDGSAAEVLADVGADFDLSQLMQDLPAVEDLLEAANDAPVIRMINALLMQAVREGASDIHVEPFARHATVRFRRDGMLRDIAEPPRALHEALVSRIKIMASLDIAEKRLPQDGRITLRLGERAVDVRVSTLPTAHGERAVLRLLEKDASRLRLDALGMAPALAASFGRLLQRPHGILLVSGPTGSGKTTTLYAALSGMDVRQRNIVTVEDPVEYDLPGIGQIPINARIDLSFARALRAILRQDPDVIMIGEIRDLETAEIAVQASLTGHLVLATLHTNDAASAVTRLVDMGVERFLLASSLVAVLAQRLLRRLCPACRQARPATPAEAQLLGAAAPPTLWSAVGCPACHGSGYAGRLGIYELLTVDEEASRLIHDDAGEHALRGHALAAGMRLLRDDALRYLSAGETSLEEVLRVTSD